MSKSITQVNYEELQRISKSLHNESEEILRLHSATRQKVEALRGGWNGDAAKAFFSEQEGKLLPSVQRVSRALNESETVLNQIMQIIHAADEETTGYFKGLGAESGNQTNTPSRQQVQEKWAGMNSDERKKWLEDWYKNLCKKLGIPPTDFKVENLPDPAGKDFTGVYKNGTIFGWLRSLTIDSDNVNGKNPFDVLNTIAHETQHQYQHYLVDHPDKRPEGISEELIKTWKDNIEHYKLPGDDFQAYLDQPIEVDARQAGEKAVAEYFSGI